MMMIGQFMARLVPRLRPLLKLNRLAIATSKNQTIKLMAETAAKAQRRMFLEMQVLLRAKKVLHAERRKLEDTVFGLRKQGKCPGVIRREGFEDIDIVLTGKDMRGFIKHPQRACEPVWIRVDGEEIKCLIDDIKLHAQQFIQKVELRRFIVGEPNQVSVPLTLTHLTHSFFYNELSIPKIYKGRVTLTTYNEDYPTMLTVDISYVHTMRPYRFGDLQNLLPPGVEISLKHHNLSDRIISFGEPQQPSPEDLYEAQAIGRSLQGEPTTPEEIEAAQFEAAKQLQKQKKQEKKKEKKGAKK